MHVLTRFGVALALGAVAASLAGCTGSEDSTRFAVTVSRSGFGEIWTMDVDGGNRVQLTESGEPETDASGSRSPAWSPDGELIAYSSSGAAVDEDPRDHEIYVMRADGSENRRLTNDRVPDGTPAWSPDGERIAFAHVPGSGTEQPDGVIVVMNADGGGRVEITRHADGEAIVDSTPAWSPDGKLIAFTRATFAAGRARADVYVVEPTGEGERLLVEDATEPAWSPDGESIAFTSSRDRFSETCFHECSVSSEIYVARADGTGLRRLTRSQAQDASPAWSPDGKRIAFVSDRSDRNGHEYEIHSMAVDGSDVRRLTTNDVWDLEPEWR